MEEEIPLDLLKIDEEVARRQVANLQDVKRKRDDQKVKAQLNRIEQAARGTDNLMNCFVDAVREYCTLGEIIDVLRGVFGEHKDPGML
jgi:methylmalonyl-CoA mutase, N-terminal domain